MFTRFTEMIERGLSAAVTKHWDEIVPQIYVEGIALCEQCQAVQISWGGRQCTTNTMWEFLRPAQVE